MQASVSHFIKHYDSSFSNFDVQGFPCEGVVPTLYSYL